VKINGIASPSQVSQTNQSTEKDLELTFKGDRKKKNSYSIQMIKNEKHGRSVSGSNYLYEQGKDRMQRKQEAA